MARSTPLLAIHGSATPEEVAALVVVLQGMAAASTAATSIPRSHSVWADPARQVRRPLHASPNGWARSALGG